MSIKLEKNREIIELDVHNENEQDLKSEYDTYKNKEINNMMYTNYKNKYDNRLYYSIRRRNKFIMSEDSEFFTRSKMVYMIYSIYPVNPDKLRTRL